MAPPVWVCLQGSGLYLLRRETVDGAGELVDALDDLIVLQLLFPGRQGGRLQLDRVDQADAGPVGEGVLLLIHGVEAAVVHVAEGFLSFAVFIDTPPASVVIASSREEVRRTVNFREP